MKPRQQHKSLEAILTNIPPVPAVVRYYDDFSDSYGEVTHAGTSDRWQLSFDGRCASLDFLNIDVTLRDLIKVWCSAILAHLSPVSTEYYFNRISSLPTDRLIRILTCEPHDVRSEWKQCHSDGISYAQLASLKNLLIFMCEFRIAGWQPQWSDLVSQLPLPKVDKYASVRTGDAFLSVDEQVAIVRHIDDVCVEIESRPTMVSDGLLELTAILVCSYQFGFRSKQIAMLEMRNIRIWNDGLSQYRAVHLTFVMIKQRSAGAVFPMVRRLKREWGPLFTELSRRAQVSGLAGSDHIFRRSPRDVSKAIGDITEIILGTRRGSRELRHSAAQRLADAGE
jgi:hypothetical protein